MNRMQSRAPLEIIYNIPGRLEVIESKDLDVELEEIIHPYLNTHVVKFIVTHKQTGITAECSRSTSAKKNRDDAIKKLLTKIAEYYDEQDTIAQIRKRLPPTSSISSSSASSSDSESAPSSDSDDKPNRIKDDYASIFLPASRRSI